MFRSESLSFVHKYDLNQMDRILTYPEGGYSRCEFVSKVESTNLALFDLVKNYPKEWQNLSVYFTNNQVKGLGRMGREWHSDPGSNIAVSICIKPEELVSRELFLASAEWFSLLSSLALVDALRSLSFFSVGIKWPNDVLFTAKNGEEYKLAGVLSHISKDILGQYFVIVGIGVNVLQNIDRLVLPNAISLREAGMENVEVQTVLIAYLRAFLDRYRDLLGCNGNLQNSKILQDFSTYCVSLGSEVVVEFPDKTYLEGKACSIDNKGRLNLLLSDQYYKVISVGDIRHLRYKKVFGKE